MPIQKAAAALRGQRVPQQGSSWHKSKPVLRVIFLAVTFTILYLFFHSLSTFQSVSFLPDRVQDGEKRRYINKATASNSDSILAGRNPNRSAKPRAAFVILIRERQLGEILPSIRDIQWAFNNDPEHGYDYVFLSETPFSSWFRDHINQFLSQSSSNTLSKPKTHFGIISNKDWNIPSNIDIEKAKRRWKDQFSGAIPYGQSTTYRQMCRYMSGPVYHHPLLANYDFIWRIEPQTQHLCTLQSHWKKQENGKHTWIERDPFRYMKENKKRYAWIMTMSEYRSTVMRLMVSVNRWRKQYPEYIARNNSMSFVSDDGIGYNMCHYWTNFEIIDLSFVRSKAYTTYFETLDKDGGFFYERWGDAPVRSLAASMMLDSSEIWQVDYAGYYHPPITQCPRTLDPGQVCACDPQNNIDYSFPMVSCRSKADKFNGIDTREVVRAINKEAGVLESFKEGEEPYAIHPPRLMSSPIL